MCSHPAVGPSGGEPEGSAAAAAAARDDPGASEGVKQPQRRAAQPRVSEADQSRGEGQEAPRTAQGPGFSLTQQWGRFKTGFDATISAFRKTLADTDMRILHVNVPKTSKRN